MGARAVAEAVWGLQQPYVGQGPGSSGIRRGSNTVVVGCFCACFALGCTSSNVLPVPLPFLTRLAFPGPLSTGSGVMRLLRCQQRATSLRSTCTAAQPSTARCGTWRLRCDSVASSFKITLLRRKQPRHSTWTIISSSHQPSTQRSPISTPCRRRLRLSRQQTPPCRWPCRRCLLLKPLRCCALRSCCCSRLSVSSLRWRTGCRTSCWWGGTQQRPAALQHGRQRRIYRSRRGRQLRL